MARRGEFDTDSECILCGHALTNDTQAEDGVNRAFSVCSDPCWRNNVWGGDTHKILGYICLKCTLTKLREPK